MLILTCNKRNPPLEVIIVAKYLHIDLKLKIEWGESTCLNTNSGNLFTDTISIIRYLCRLAPKKRLYGETLLQSTEIDHWLSFATLQLKNPEHFETSLAYLERVLGPINFLVGHALTLADIIVWSILYINPKWQFCVSNGFASRNILRWYNYLSGLEVFVSSLKFSSDFNKNLKSEFISNNMTSKIAKSKDEGKFIDLPGAEMSKVVVRFPPEASGYLHIGHAKAALLNQYYQIQFQGKLIMRFDDTNPAKEKEDFEKVILEDIELLQIKPDKFSYTSDYFDLMLLKCDALLKNGSVFVDDTDPEVMKIERVQRKESKNRNNTIEKNLQMWEEMKKGSDYGQQCCVRAKIDMKSDNGCMRDPTLYRCKNEIHSRTGDKYKVYPTYDFACPIVDSIENVTHALRTTEYHDRDDQYFWILESLGMRKPYIYEYSRLNMMNTVLSKRKLTWFVQNQIVDSWEDPRMPTVRGVLRRGMTVEGLKQFIVAQGSSRSVVIMDWDKIWAFNKKIIDPVAPRYNAVEKTGAIEVLVNGVNEKSMEVPKHPKNPEVGSKIVWIGPKLLIDESDAQIMKEGSNVTFINWGNLFIKSIMKDKDGNVLKIEADLNLDNKEYKKTQKVTWVAKIEKVSLIPCVCVYYDHLIYKPILGKDEDFRLCLNENTRIEVDMLGDSELSELKKSDIIQLQRKGFFICDEPYDLDTVRHIGRENPLVLISIPDGSKDMNIFPKKVISKRIKLENEKEKLYINKENSPQNKEFIKTASDKDLDKQIKEQGNLIRTLKSEKVDKEKIDGEVKILLNMKSKYKSLTGIEWKPLSNIQCKNQMNNVQNIVTEESSSTDNLNNRIILQENEVLQRQCEKSKNPNIDNKIFVEKQFKSLNNYENVKTELYSEIELNNQIILQGNKIRQMKIEKLNKDILDQEIKILLNLKSDFKTLTGKEWTPNQNISDQTAYVNKYESLNSIINQQGDKIRKMKEQKINKDILSSEIQKLLELKAEFKNTIGKEWKSELKNSQLKSKSEENFDHLSATELKNTIDVQGATVKNLKNNKGTNSEMNKVQHLLKTDYQNLIREDLITNNENKEGKAKLSFKDEQVKTESQSTSINIQQEKKKANPSIKKITRLGLEVKKEENLADWYSQVITKAEMIEYYDVSGCYILRPWAYAIWENIKNYFDNRLKEIGVQNCYFPMFVSAHALEREKTHIADFAPEVAWVTKSGDTNLAESIAIRPTSETVMYPSYAKWIKSHRDLPLQLNQWCNIVRWEFKHPQPFLRTREFLWQEGHSAFATQEEAIKEVHVILEMYADIYEKLLAIPVIRGRKTEKEKFAGGDFTTTVEAFISASGRAIQGGTSHHLGQNFSKMFEIIFEHPENNEKQFVYQNSWGLTTRTIGVMTMIHGDNIGLVLPPKVASCQVVVVPCGLTATLTEDIKFDLINKCKDLVQLLKQADIRVKGDFRDNYSPGWKFNHWELKGVPIRIELGPRDVKQQQFIAVRRDNGEKIVLSVENIVNQIKLLLDDIQSNLYSTAIKDLEEHLTISYNWDDFCHKLDSNYIIQSPFCGEMTCEDQIKKDSAKDTDIQQEIGAPSMGAKSLCIPFNQPGIINSTMKCIYPSCKNLPKYFVLFGRSY